jgi:hypothetical protein
MHASVDISHETFACARTCKPQAHCRVLAHVQGTDSLMPHLLIETIETSPSPSPARSCDKESSHADPVGKAGRKRGEWVRAAGGWIDALVDFLPRVNVAAMDQADGDLSRLDQISRHYAHVTKVLEANSLRACNSLARSARNDEGSKQNGLGSEASEGTRPQEHENAWAEREKKEGKGKQEVKPCVVGRICGDLPSSGQAVALSCERRTRVLSTPLGDEGRSARAHGVGAHGGSVLGNGGGAGDENSEECWLYDLIRDLVWEWTSLLRSPLFLCDIGRLGGVRAGQGGHWDQGARRIQSSRTNGQSQGGEESLGVLTGRILKQYLEQDSEIKRRLFSRHVAGMLFAGGGMVLGGWCTVCGSGVVRCVLLNFFQNVCVAADRTIRWRRGLAGTAATVKRCARVAV